MCSNGGLSLRMSSIWQVLSASWKSKPFVTFPWSRDAIAHSAIPCKRDTSLRFCMMSFIQSLGLARAMSSIFGSYLMVGSYVNRSEILIVVQGHCCVQKESTLQYQRPSLEKLTFFNNFLSPKMAVVKIARVILWTLIFRHRAIESISRKNNEIEGSKGRRMIKK